MGPNLARVREHHNIEINNISLNMEYNVYRDLVKVEIFTRGLILVYQHENLVELYSKIVHILAHTITFK